MSDPESVFAPVELLFVAADGDLVPVDANFGYVPADPYAVRVEFKVPQDEPVTWVFARDLLADGLEAPAGHGDVGVWPSNSLGEEVVCLALSSPDGRALLECRRDDISGFLEQTLATVPAGQESRHLDVDSSLARLLAD